AENLQGAVAEHALGGGAKGLDDAALVDHHHPVRDRIEDRAQYCLALAKGCIGALGGGDVAGNLRRADDPPGMVADRRDRQCYLYDAAIFAASLSLIVL